MSEGLLPTPTDAVGMPLPIAPNRPVKFHSPDLFDRNHVFHPARHPELADPAGDALRNSRIQYVDWWEHHNVYHPTYGGPPIPSRVSEKARLTILAAALYVPDHAIDCSRAKPRQVRLNDDQRNRLWKSGEITMASPTAVRRFLMNYVVEQDLSHIPELMIEEFLNTPDYLRKRQLGNWLISEAVDMATEPMNQQYYSLWKAKKIPHSLPSRPKKTVNRILGLQSNRRDVVVKALGARLAAAA